MSGWDDPRYVQGKFEELSRKVDSMLNLAVQQKGPVPGWIRGAVIEAARIISPSIEVSQGGGQAAVMMVTITASGQPWIEVVPSAIELLITPQLAVADVRDTTASTAVLINDEQQAFDAGLTQRTYSEISLVQGGTTTTDLFNTVSLPGGLGPGARISRRGGLQWAVAGTWAVDVSFFARYHAAPSSVTLTQITADTLNGGTKQVTFIDYFGFILGVQASAGAGFTFNRWTASGGN